MIWCIYTSTWSSKVNAIKIASTEASYSAEATVRDLSGETGNPISVHGVSHIDRDSESSI